MNFHVAYLFSMTNTFYWWHTAGWDDLFDLRGLEIWRLDRLLLDFVDYRIWTVLRGPGCSSWTMGCISKSSSAPHRSSLEILTGLSILYVRLLLPLHP